MYLMKINGKEKKWTGVGNYLDAWERNKRYFEGRVKSMSGMTKELLGEPTQEWFMS